MLPSVNAFSLQSFLLAGGTGIHRPAAKREEKVKSTKTKDSYGQEYRAKVSVCFGMFGF